jgi:hypothetical protein
MALAAKVFGISKSSLLKRMQKGKMLLATRDHFGYYYWMRSDFENYISSAHAEKLRILKDGR